MVTYNITNRGLEAQLAAIAVFLSASNRGIYHLFTAPTSISDTIDSTYFTEATFPGYTLKPVTTYTVLASGPTVSVPSVSFGPVTFVATGGTPQTIQGAWVDMQDDFSGFALRPAFALLLPNGPQVVSQPGDSIVAQLTLTLQRAPGQP